MSSDFRLSPRIQPRDAKAPHSGVARRILAGTAPVLADKKPELGLSFADEERVLILLGVSQRFEPTRLTSRRSFRLPTHLGLGDVANSPTQLTGKRGCLANRIDGDEASKGIRTNGQTKQIALRIPVDMDLYWLRQVSTSFAG